MVKRLLYIVIFFCFVQMLHAQQEDGVAAFALPVRNSLKFNKYAINPTFSFVREQNKYLSFTNKREWVQFENAPQTYLFSYSGRFGENTGAGIGLFQQNYGVLTTFGGVINYAYNAVLDRDSNLTFGMNLGFYKSGINEGNVVTNFSEPSLQNSPSNMLITLNPGINYGTTFFDFGVSLNNIVTYNLKTSQIIEENPEQSIQGHLMYTGYVDSRGFFDNSKFSSLVRSEFKKEQTVLSGIMMLTTAKGIWAQAGYNTLYGMSAGIGLNITSQIALEYNYEKEVGDMSTFGNSHEITLAYRFNKKYRYNYGDEDEDDVALISPARKSRSTSSKRNIPTGGKVDREAIAEAKEQARAEALAKLEAKKAARLQSIEDAKSDQTIKAQAKSEEEARIKRAQEAQVKAEEEARIKLAQETQAKAEEAAKIKLVEETKAKAEEEARIKLAQEVQAKAKAEEQARIKLAEETKAKVEEEARIKLAQETQAKAEEAARIKLKEETKAKAEEEARIKLAQEAQAKAKAEEHARIKLAEEAKAKAEEATKLKLAQETQAKAEEAARIKLAEETKAKAKAEEATRLKLAQEEQAKAEEEARIKAEEEARINQEELDAALILVPTDATGIAMSNLTKLTTDSKIKQDELLIKLNETVANREKDLKDLKEENDLSEQGIYKEPKPFKSVSGENAALESLTNEIDDIIKSQDLKIKELENLYNERLKKVPSKEDSVNMIYLNEILILKEAQAKAKRSKETLVSELESIKIATEIERKRRIKRAAYDNEEDRYNKDKLALDQIKKFTETSTVPLKNEDFDFGEPQGDNIKIVKDIRNVESGYYLVLAVHSDVAKRDEFLTKAVASGQNNINFFYDIATSKYYIYYEKFDDITNARNAMQSKGSTPYNGNMSLVKIEN